MEKRLEQKLNYWIQQLEWAESNNDGKRIDQCILKIQEIEELQGY